jgi:hypothetical protein
MARAFEDSDMWAERYKSLKGFEEVFADMIFPDPDHSAR